MRISHFSAIVFAGVVTLTVTACAPAPKASSAAPAIGNPATPLPAITWQQDRALTWADFQGNVPQDRLNESTKDRLMGSLPIALTRTHEAAETVSSIRSDAYRYTYDCAHQNATPHLRCRVTGIELGAAHAEFDPNGSWAIREDETPELLRHEQGHFDVAAIYALKMEAAMQTAIPGLVGKVVGAGDDQQTVDAAIKAAVDRAVGQVRDEVIQQFAAEQTRYDQETRHGTDTASQKLWSGRLNAALRNSAPQ